MAKKKRNSNEIWKCHNVENSVTAIIMKMAYENNESNINQ